MIVPMNNRQRNPRKLVHKRTMGEEIMMENPLLNIQRFGQSIWLDDIDRAMIMSEKLKKMIDEDGIRGVTSNPKIFKDVIAEGQEYESAP